MSGYLKRYLVDFSSKESAPKDGPFIIPGDLEDEGRLWKSLENPGPQPWEYFASAQSIVLLGPPRIGKTSEFERQRQQCQNGFILRLRDVDPVSPNRFSDAIEDLPSWENFIASEERGELFIDALDEGKLAERKTIISLTNWLNGLGQTCLGRLRIHLSCRAHDWKAMDTERWMRLFPDHQPQTKHAEDQPDLTLAGENTDDTPAAMTIESPRVAVLEMLDLDKEQYEVFCYQNDVSPTALLEAMPPRAHPLLARPLTLKMSTDYFKHNSGIVGDLITLFSHSIDKKIGEQNREYQDYRAHDSREVPVSTKRQVAGLYACATLLCGTDLIAVSDDNQHESLPMGLSGKDNGSEKTALTCDLFQSFGQNLVRFDQPEFCDYMAATHIDELIRHDAITGKGVWELLAPAPGHQEVVPRLRGLALWLAAINDDFRDHVVECSPLLLLHDYPGGLPDDIKLAVWEWLVSNYGNRDFFYEPTWDEGCAILACNALVPKLLTALENPENYGPGLRRLAAIIAGHSKWSRLADVLEYAVQHTDDNPSFLIKAAEALAVVAPARLGVLKKWLELPVEKDSLCQLRGVALAQLWPTHLTIHELIRNLIDQPGQLIGRYWDFYRRLPDDLELNDIWLVAASMCERLSRQVASELEPGTKSKFEFSRSPIQILEALLFNLVRN